MEVKKTYLEKVLNGISFEPSSLRDDAKKLIRLNNSIRRLQDKQEILKDRILSKMGSENKDIYTLTYEGVTYTLTPTTLASYDSSISDSALFNRLIKHTTINKLITNKVVRINYNKVSSIGLKRNPVVLSDMTRTLAVRRPKDE